MHVTQNNYIFLYSGSVIRLLSLLILVLGCLAAAPSRADDLIVSRAVLEDPTGRLTIDEVRGREFQPVGPTLLRGYTRAAHWLRLQLRAPDKGGQAVLLIRPAYLDEVQLFEPDAGPARGWRMRSTGDRHAYDTRDVATISPSFLVAVPPGGTTLYLRLQTSSTSLLNLSALTPLEAQRSEHRLELLLAGFVAAMLWALAWAVHDYAADHEPVVGLFIVQQLVYLLYGLALNGYAAPLVPAGLPWLADGLTSLLACGVTFANLLFSRALLKLYEPPRLWMSGFSLLLLAFPLELVAMSLGGTGLALHANAILILVGHWFLLLGALLARQEQVPSRRLLQASLGVLALFGTPAQLADLGWPLASDAYLNATLVTIGHVLVGSALMVMLLYMRSRQLKLHGQRSTLELLLSQRTLDIERALKEKAELEARTDHLTGILNRRRFFELAERERARAVRYQRPLSMLMIDADYFKNVNDTWGHSAGDQVLQEMARRIRSELRDVDIFGRLGGEEFAVLLVEVDAEGARDVAQRLRAVVARAYALQQDDASTELTISVGLASLNGREVGIEQLLREADEALYQAKRAGRDRVEVWSERLAG